MNMDDIEAPLPSAESNSPGWASDVAAEMLRHLGIKWVALNPGASYRGLHDSLVNHLGNRDPQMLLCLNEDRVISIPHGYAKVMDEPLGLCAAQQCRPHARADGRVQRVVRPHADADPGRHRPRGAGQAPALDRLNTHLQGSGRAAARFHQMG